MARRKRLNSGDDDAVRWLTAALSVELTPEQRARVETALRKTPYRDRLRVLGYTDSLAVARPPAKDRQLPDTLEEALDQLPVIATSRFVPTDLVEIWRIGHVIHKFRGYKNGACVEVAKRLGLSVGIVSAFHRLRRAYELEDIQDIVLPWSAVKLTLGIKNKADRPSVLRGLDQQYREAAEKGTPLSVRKIQEKLRPRMDQQLQKKRRRRARQGPATS